MFNRLFEEVFNRYSERVRRWCYRVTKDQESAADLTQEVFLKIFRKIHTFRGDSQLSTWIYVITRNHCLNTVKQSRNEPKEFSKVSCSRAGSNPTDLYLAVEQSQVFERVCCFLTSILNPMEMTVLSLHYMHDLSLPAITRRLTLSNASGAKAYLVSARRKLKCLVREHTCAADFVVQGTRAA